MNHLLILPILVPLCCACLLLFLRGASIGAARGLALLSSLLQLGLAGLLLAQSSDGAIQLYAAGHWLPPYGIVLVLDRLAALMLFTTAVLALPALLYAAGGADRDGKYFHVLWQFQLMGINGAFLTGDLFNLFVFFEVLLMASYGLLLHGRGAARLRAGLQYVVLNLLGSALFLLAAGIFYGLAGTLNLADLSVFIAVAEPADTPLLAAAGLLLLIVFGLKAALFPWYFWLPRSYAVASAPVAALFAIMSKVGIYATLRLTLLLFGAHAGALAGLLLPWLWPLALLTLILGSLGVLAATTLAELIAYCVVVSVGTLLSALALNSMAALTALLYYLMQSTWIVGALFLLVDLIAGRRGSVAGRLQSAPKMASHAALGGLFLIAALAVVGLPPLAGFVGKLLLLQAAPLPDKSILWLALLASSLVGLVAFSRAGSVLFWRTDTVVWRAGTAVPAPMPLPINAVCAVIVLLGAHVALSVCGAPIVKMLEATAAQLFDAEQYTAAVLVQMQNPAGVEP
ncbi:MAG TPA: monovalent cation/H+ antiporter subunit D [Spongiibacteraceae bacterium]|nr:monovalent cation/H+ antiporter subunit D [Spongiibacteraceae bacterium]